MSYSKLDIVNWALRMMGETPIVSLTAPQNAAQVASQLYPLVIKSELVKNIWNFAKETVVLSPVVKEIDDEFASVFKLPTNCLRILGYGNQYNDYSYQESIKNQIYVNDGYVYCKSETESLKVTYINGAVMEADFDPSFAKSSACALAVEMVYPLKNSENKRDRLLNDYNISIRGAKRISALSNPPIRKSNGSIMLARRSW